MSFSLKATSKATPAKETVQKIKQNFEAAEALTTEEIQAVLDAESTHKETPKGLGGFKFKPKPATESVPAALVSTTGPVSDAAPQESLKVEESSPPTLMPNEVPAEAVVRELADDASPGVLKFVEMLDSVPKLFHDPDTLGQVIRNIMVSLSEEESFIQMVQPDDYKFIIRGMRDVLEGAAIKKASTKRKASPKKAKKTALDSDDLAMLDDLMSGI